GVPCTDARRQPRIQHLHAQRPPACADAGDARIRQSIARPVRRARHLSRAVPRVLRHVASRHESGDRGGEGGGAMSAVGTPSDQYAARLTRVTLVWVAVGLVLFPVLALLGVVMRTLQAGFFAATPPEWFYAVMTLHGLGMVGVWFVAGLAALIFV